MTTATLLTCSFAGDLDLCALLCESVDRFAPAGVEHYLFVPARDRAAFARFASPRRRILAQEDLLPRWFFKAPLPSPAWRERLGLPRRNVYLTPFSAPVRGWIAQQMMKISASLAASSDVVAHLDSDMAIVRPLALSHLMRGGEARFFAERHPTGLPAQRPWYAAAARLLGLPEADYSRTLYIDQFVVWRPDVARAMVSRIEATTGRDWRVALARTPHFAEYVLYGLFVDEVLGREAAGVRAQPRSLCHSRWSEPLAGPHEEDAFLAALGEDQVACMIQSTLPMPREARARLFARAERGFAEAA